MLIPTGRALKEYQISPQELEDVFNFVYDVMKLKIMKVNPIAGSEPFRRVAVTRYLIEKGKIGEDAVALGELYFLLKNKLEKMIEKEDSSQNAILNVKKTRSEKNLVKAYLSLKMGMYILAAFCH